jgi:hypothetical protein
MGDDAMVLLLGEHTLVFQFAGLTLSLGVGPGNYCDNHQKDHNPDERALGANHVTTTMEVALWGSGPTRGPGNVPPVSRHYLRIGGNEDVAGWVAISKLPAIMLAFMTEDVTDDDKRQMIAFLCNRNHSEGATSL